MCGAKFLPLRVHPHFRLTASRHISTEMASIWGCGSSIWGCGSREGEGRRQRNGRNRLTGVPGGPVSHSLRRGVHVWLTTDPGGALPSVLAVQNIRGVRDRSGRGTARHPHLSNIRYTRWSRGDGVVNVADVQLMGGQSLTFSELDALLVTSGAPRVAIVNETLARQYFPGGDALGKHVTPMWDGYNSREIIGIIRDIHDCGLNAKPVATIYVPYGQFRARLRRSGRAHQRTARIRHPGTPPPHRAGRSHRAAHKLQHHRRACEERSTRRASTPCWRSPARRWP